MAYINGKKVMNAIVEEVIGGSIIVDQTYKPDSANAQSGKAVAELELKIPLVDQAYEQHSPNAQSGTAVKEAMEEAKTYIDNELAKFDFIKIVNELPDTGLPNRLYLVPKSEQSDNDLFDEYILANKGTEENPIYDWEWITTKQVEVDLTDYALISDVDASIDSRIDQTYKPGSTNAQSGTAVAEGIESRIDKTFTMGSENAQSGEAMAEMYALLTDDFLQSDEDYWGRVGKVYVDEQVGNIETALDSIIAIQNSLIGGDA